MGERVEALSEGFAIASSPGRGGIGGAVCGQAAKGRQEPGGLPGRYAAGQPHRATGDL